MILYLCPKGEIVTNKKVVCKKENEIPVDMACWIYDQSKTRAESSLPRVKGL